jgi:hypothetical protein
MDENAQLREQIRNLWLEREEMREAYRALEQENEGLRALLETEKKKSRKRRTANRN